MEKRRVITSFLELKGKILLLKRSNRVGTHRGKWAGVSGYINSGEEPLNAALREIEEETGLSSHDVELLREGKILPIPDGPNNILWLVKPFLFRIHTEKIRIDWEHQKYWWIRPEDIESYETVPMLKETLERVTYSRPEVVIINPEVIKGIQEIRSDRTHGATWLALKALQIVKLASERCEVTDVRDYIRYLKVVINDLINTRASMAPLRTSLSLLFHSIWETSALRNLLSLKTFTASKVEELTVNFNKANIDIAKHAAKLVDNGDIIMSHSYSSTIQETFKEAVDQGKNFRAVITESRPLFEGRTAAKELTELGVPVELIIDSAAAYAMPSVNKVLVGADSVLADGSVVNKVGTHLVALAAKDVNVPFYAVTQKFKYDVSSYLGEEVALEEKNFDEVWDKPANGIKIRNLYFEITPARHISGIVTEDGLVKPEEVTSQIEKILPHMYLGW